MFEEITATAPPSADRWFMPGAPYLRARWQWRNLTAMDKSCCSTPRDIAASIWWPESTTLHNNIDLRLVDPTAIVVRSSRSINSVFEKLQHPGPVPAGTWNLRITGRTVSGTQQVFYAAYAKKEAWAE